MKVLIDIPKEFEVDYNADRFAEFFHRCFADMGTCCGNYEYETEEMMEKAFADSRLYDPDKVVEQLEECGEQSCDDCPYLSNNEIDCKQCAMLKAIEIVKAGGINDNSN